ncbi:MetQ/NlpA family ABC transporter substrate-binding protein [Mariniluteicoccus flavus]
MNRRLFLQASGGLALLAGVGTTACSAGSAGALRVAASSVPHAEILNHLKESGALKDVQLKITEVTGDLDPNQLLVAGDVDANFFQHVPYADDWSKQHNTTDLANIAEVHVEPLGLYSRKVTALDALAPGATIALSNNVTNFARGLFLLADAGLLTLDAQRGASAIGVTQKNITGNPKNLKFVEVDPAQIPRTLDDPAIALGVVNGNYALEAGLKPATDALKLEPAQGNPYANVLTVLKKNAQDARVTALAAALTSPAIGAWIGQRYSGSVLPVHKGNQ